MNPYWLILLLPAAATLGLMLGCLLASGAYQNGYEDGYELGRMGDPR